MLRGSGLNETLENNLMIDGQQYYMYGDDAYVLRPWFQMVNDRRTETGAQQILNTKMSSVRKSVQCGYKDLKQMWTRNDFARSLKVRQAPISMLYIACALFLNVKTCMENGGKVGS